MEDLVKKTKYKYDQNSNLVLQGNSTVSRNENEPSGEGETLGGKKLASFGDMAQREKGPELKKMQENAKKRQEEKLKKQNQEIVNPKKATKLNIENDQNIMNMQIEEDLVYKPKTKETKQVYDQLLAVIKPFLGDISEQDMKAVADETLAILKNEEGTQTEQVKKKAIDYFFSQDLPEAFFGDLVLLAQQLGDYNPSEEYRGERQEEEYQAIINFDEEEDEDDDAYMVKEDEEMEEQNRESVEDVEMEIHGGKDITDDSLVVIDTSKNNQQSRSKGDVDVSEIDAQWLNRVLTEQFSEQMSEEVLQIEKKVMGALAISNERECQKELLGILGNNKFSLMKLLQQNRFAIYFASRYHQAQNQKEKNERVREMQAHREGKKVYDELMGSSQKEEKEDKLLEKVSEITKKYDKTSFISQQEMHETLKKQQITENDMLSNLPKQTQLDLEQLQFQQGARLMANKNCKLPKGSQRISKNGYEQIFVPGLRQKPTLDEKNIKISQMPEWARKAFPESVKELNRIQSKLYEAAFNSSENLLVCAPTGAGKTNIAMLAILQTIKTYLVKTSSGILKPDLRLFKVVYVAPMKALVSEIVGNFQLRLKGLGLQVRELTGDVNLTKQQVEETQVIVTTPEKWDIVTRKSGDRTYTELVKLIIIDEIHLLHDSRGPVLEALVARTVRQIESTQEQVRIVGLSATLPNYEDVAAFLRVDPAKGLYYFDNSYRPVPLEQIYIGVTEQKALKRMLLMNEICYEKVQERAGKVQILIFVHSRKETARTAKIIRDMALAQDKLHLFLKDHSSKDILQAESQIAKTQDLKDLLPFGIGIHHAGLPRSDRQQVEQLFADDHLQLLVSTATLAWGVNLPAHTVMIKGTQIYSPEQGKWIELSPQDMLQMLGRAGRPQYDKLGEGIVITGYDQLQYYLSLNNMQLPIESQMISQIQDQLNAEIVMGNCTNVKEGVNWLGYTYLYVRMLRNPTLYGISQEEIETDPYLIQRRTDLIHTSSILLQKAGMIRYDKRTGVLQNTSIGKIASHYYIKCNSMSIYNENLKSHMNIIDVFRVFSLSKEFSFIPIRDNEKLELVKFIDKVPIPVKGSLDEPATKINILLQAYISKFKLEGYDLNSDMVYVTQSAGRLMRALLEISLKKQWAQLSEAILGVCKMIDRRMWSTMSPLRQYGGIPEEFLRKIEKKEQFTWHHYQEMNAQQIGEIIKSAKLGKIIQKKIKQFPKLELQAYCQPITRSIIKIDMFIHADFYWEAQLHGKAESFLILVEDCDQEEILHSEQFILREQHMSQEHEMTFIVPLTEPLPPQYFIKVISERWIQSEAILPISFKHLVLPDKFAPPMELQDMHSRLVKELKFKQAEEYFIKERGIIKEFTSIQTQAFDKLYLTDESVFVGAPSGSNNIVCAELAMFRHLKKEENKNNQKIVYICSSESLCRIRYQNWNNYFAHSMKTCLLTSESGTNYLKDLEEVQQSTLIIATAEKWEVLSRKWQREQLKRCSLYIIDELQMLPEVNACLEVVASRIRYMQVEGKDLNIRIVALSTSIANAKDLSNWLGIQYPQNTFNFHPSVRPIPIEVLIQGFDHNNKQVRTLTMEKPSFNLIKKHLGTNKDNQAIVFVSDRKQCRLTTVDFVTFSCSDEDPKMFLNFSQKDDQQYLQSISDQIEFTEPALVDTLEYGLAYIHEGLSQQERTKIKSLYQKGIIRVLVATYSLCWEMGDLSSHLVLLMDPCKQEGIRIIEYQISELLQIQGLATKRGEDKQIPKCIVMCHEARKEYFVKFMQEPMPIESNMEHYIHDLMNAQVANNSVRSRQDAVDWVTWQFYYRRLSQNPNYYNLVGKSGENINDHISELVENTLDDLVKARCVEIKEEDQKNEDEDEVQITNFGRIAAFFNISYKSVRIFADYFENQSKCKFENIIDLLSNCYEFEGFVVKQGEEVILKSLAVKLKYHIANANFNERNVKVNMLIQFHLSRTQLTQDLRADQKSILEKSIQLIHAMVEVVSSYGHIKVAMKAMEMSQMLVQAVFISDLPLLQLPNIRVETAEALKSQVNVVDVADLMNMEDEDRNQYLNQLSSSQMNELVQACNRYPDIQLSYNLINYSNKDGIQEGESLEVEVVLQRSGEGEDLDIYSQPVMAQFYPLVRYLMLIIQQEKEEQWWVLIGDSKGEKLLTIKRISNFKAQKNYKTKLSFIVNKEDQHNNHVEFKVFLINDSYLHCDQEETIKVLIY